ncbi:hypothetical protein [Nocardia mangyaensis]|nr:hypothetical protein [Nocardia mangyaensis]
MSNEKPRLAPRGWSGRLSITPAEPADPATPAHEDAIHGQPAWHSESTNALERRKLDLTMYEALLVLETYGEMSANAYRHFMGNTGDPYRFSNNEVEMAALGTEWGKSALFFGQTTTEVDATWDPRPGLRESVTIPYDPYNPTTRPGLTQTIERIAAEANGDDSLFASPHGLLLDWRRTPADWANEDNPDVHNALGHYNLGADGVVSYTKLENGDIAYRAQFQAKVWDYYKFDERVPTEDDGFVTTMKIEVNNLSRMAHAAGQGRNFIAYGTSDDIVAEGIISNGEISDSVTYYRADDPENKSTINRADKYDPGSKPPDKGTLGYASGGLVRGPVSADGVIPARPHDGEFVVGDTAASGMLVEALTGSIDGFASSVSGQVGAMIGTAVGGPVSDAIGGATEIVSKPIQIVAEAAKEMIEPGFGQIELAPGSVGGRARRGDIYNISGLDPKSVQTAVERVRRRRMVATPGAEID